MVSSSSGSEAKKRDNENWNVPFVETTKLERRRVIGRRRVVGKSMGLDGRWESGKRDELAGGEELSREGGRCVGCWFSV